MADKETSGLTAAAALAGTDLFHVVQSGNSRKATGAQLQALANLHPGFIVGNWYALQRGVVATGVVGQDTIQLTPFAISAPITLSDLGTRVTTALASNNFQLAIYANNAATGRPTGNALASTGNISTASAVNVSADITGANVPLTPGIYWAAVNHSGATSTVMTVALSGTGGSAYFIGSATLANLSSGINVNFILTVAQAFGTWPDLTSASFTEVAGAGGVFLFGKAA